MGATIDVFKRVEKKYRLNEEQYKLFRERIEPYMAVDEYGLHTICNIYYDTEDSELIRTSIEKPPYKEKLRLRSYGIPKDEDTVFLEIKKKYKGVVYKRRIALTLQEAMAYLEDGIKPENQTQIFREIDYFIHHYHTVPKLYIAYDRIAMFGKEDDSIRMTFDQNIRSREMDMRLDHGDYGKVLSKEKMYLLEIKVSGAMPLWMSGILAELKIYPASFSKYGNIYKESISALELVENERAEAQTSAVTAGTMSSIA